ncbi:MAG TPA: hypothetical protein ENK44_09910 [Caldithrix abyssi]|uniref:Uncharacterized protein n=1 Tax=Caldithrix abyssi TaxID=187145 RepID=A0A7V4U2C1_CALAY|nr:hypothetical protein [Caldithrix abyssi]
MSSKENLGSNGIAQIRDLIVGEDMAKVNDQIRDIHKQLDSLHKQLAAQQEQTQKTLAELQQGQTESLKSTEQSLQTQIKTIIERLEQLETVKVDRETLGEYLIETGRRIKENLS